MYEIIVNNPTLTIIMAVAIIELGKLFLTRTFEETRQAREFEAKAQERELKAGVLLEKLEDETGNTFRKDLIALFWDLYERLDRVEAENERVREKYLKVYVENVELRKENEELHRQNEQLETLIQELKDKIQRLEKRIVKLEQEREELIRKLGVN